MEASLLRRRRRTGGLQQPVMSAVLTTALNIGTEKNGETNPEGRGVQPITEQMLGEGARA